MYMSKVSFAGRQQRVEKSTEKSPSRPQRNADAKTRAQDEQDETIDERAREVQGESAERTEGVELVLAGIDESLRFNANA